MDGLNYNNDSDADMTEIVLIIRSETTVSEFIIGLLNF